MERVNCKKEAEVWENEENILHLRYWVSLRGQTLCRTGMPYVVPTLFHKNISSFSLSIYMNIYIYLLNAVRGMMYYRRALKLQAFLDMADEEGKTTISQLQLNC